MTINFPYKFYGNGHSDRNFNHEIKAQRAIKQKLGCDFIKANADKEYFEIFKAINVIFRYIKQKSIQLTKESIKKNKTEKNSIRLSGLKFTKAIKDIVKKIFPAYMSI